MSLIDLKIFPVLVYRNLLTVNAGRYPWPSEWCTSRIRYYYRRSLASRWFPPPWSHYYAKSCNSRIKHFIFSTQFTIFRIWKTSSETFLSFFKISSHAIISICQMNFTCSSRCYSWARKQLKRRIYFNRLLKILKSTKTYCICFSTVDFPHSPAPERKKIDICWFFDILSTVHGFSQCLQAQYKYRCMVISKTNLPKSSSFTMELAARLSAFSCFSISLFFAANSAFSWLWQAPISRQNFYWFIDFRPKWSISRIINIFSVKIEFFYLKTEIFFE